MKGYTLGKSPKNPASRQKKVSKIVKIVSQEKNLAQTTLLDIGTGAGFIAAGLAKKAKAVKSVDVVDYRTIKQGYEFKLVKGAELPFPAKTFDIVVSNQVIEHIADANKHLSEIARVLKGDGIVYLASPNKWWISDPHYKLPFISWLPRPLSNLYLIIFKRRKWDIYSLSLRKLSVLTRRHNFVMEDKTWEILKNPEKYMLKVGRPQRIIIRLVPSFLRGLLLNFVPTHVKLLKLSSKTT